MELSNALLLCFIFNNIQFVNQLQINVSHVCECVLELFMDIPRRRPNILFYQNQNARSIGSIGAFFVSEHESDECFVCVHSILK